MATTLASCISQARLHLKETTARFWSDAELFAIAVKGCNDMWGAIIDLNQEHYLTVDTSNVTLAAAGTSLTGVPTDTFRVHIIEPSDTTAAGASRGVMFVPRDYNSPEFIRARSMSAQDPGNGIIIYYTLTGSGSPIAAPTVLVAPAISATLALRFVYVPSLPALTLSGPASNNPIPGESDQAIIAWIIAFARAKEREDRSPDPNWLRVYATEKQSLLTRMTPRQTQEPDVVDGFFQDLWC